MAEANPILHIYPKLKHWVITHIVYTDFPEKTLQDRNATGVKEVCFLKYLEKCARSS